VEGMIRMMDSPDDMVGPVNIGNPHEITVRELAERVIGMTGSASRIVFRPLPADDPMQRCPNIGIAKDRLGWEPQVPLEAGLARTIAYFDRLLGMPSASRVNA